MDFEKNQASLRKAIGQLPEYEPKALVWNRISQQLDTAAPAEEAPLPLSQLPEYSPPPEVWNQLSKSLEEDSRLRRKGARRLKLSSWPMRVAAAGLVLVAALFWLLREPGPKVSVAYAQEQVSSFGLDIDWNEEEEAFARLEKQLAESNRPELNSLHQELEELSAAKAEVVGMLTSYGEDPKLINQLGEIERERSEIYRQIIKQI